ncbi:MAG: Gfo/Idh/MocA family oxidoreductase, partial [Marinosulfonomonas sp.]|nr:Gfo/Idh/MocA family oxidoreductase [Marinosulfonomonas sp.]
MPIGLGVIGLGRGFMLTLPSILADDRVRLVAATAPRAASRDAFTNQFGGRAYRDAAEMCADPAVEAVYIATPHHLHADHVTIAAAAGKHILVEKPLSISMADGQAMVAAARAAGVHLIVGPSHSFDAPVLQARALIEAGNLGRVRMVQSLNYTDFLYRPRRPEELRTDEGGGVVFNQAVHQIDVLRLLAGSPALTVQS